jgi:hypothetical protein
MRTLSAISVLCCLCSCSAEPTKATAEELDKQLPDRFVLACAAPAQPAAPALKDGFKAAIDLTSKRYRLSFEPAAGSIKSINDQRIVLADEHLERGVDNNPSHRVIRFDGRTGVFSYDEAYAAFVPFQLAFTTDCKIVPNA